MARISNTWFRFDSSHIFFSFSVFYPQVQSFGTAADHPFQYVATPFLALGKNVTCMQKVT
jgi:hypothetical protein